MRPKIDSAPAPVVTCTPSPLSVLRAHLRTGPGPFELVIDVPEDLDDQRELNVLQYAAERIRLVVRLAAEPGYQ